MLRAIPVYLVYYAALACVAPFMAPYYRSLGLGFDQVGLLASLSATVGLISGPTWGAVHDRLPRARWLIPLASIIGIAGALTLGAAGSSPWIVAGVAMVGIGQSGTLPMLDVRALDIVGSDRSRYSLLRMWGSVAFFAAAPLVGLVVAARGSSAFLLVYVPLLALTALTVLLLPRRSASARSVGFLSAPGRVLRDRTIVLYLAAALVAWTALYGQTAFMTVYLQQLNAPPEQIGLMMSIGALLEVPTMLFFPRLVARVGLEPLLIVGALFVALRHVTAALLTDPVLLIAFTAFQGVGYGLLLIGGVAFVSSHAPKGSAASAQGILSAVSGGMGTIIGALAGGQIATAIGLQGFFAVCAGVELAAAGLIAIVVLPVFARERASAHAREAARIVGQDAIET